MDIPAYPDSRPLDAADKAAFDRAFSLDPPEISEFTFTNLYAWRHAYRFHVSQRERSILVASQREKTRSFFVPIGGPDIAATLRSVLQRESCRFIRVPEPVYEKLRDDPQLESTPDRDNADYLYRVRDLIELKGRKYDGKRNLIRSFVRETPYRYVRLTHANVEECLAFASYWCVVRDCAASESLTQEREAVTEMIRTCGRSRLTGGAIVIEKKFSGVAIAEALNPRTMVMHVLKAVPGITGLYQALLHEFLSREAPGFEYVNLEQDLGIEGLREAKRSYHPLRMVNKYTVTLKG